jgi:hypothetical protein
MTSKPDRTRSLDRLRELPEVFSLGMVCTLFEMTRGMASTYISRWKDVGLVSSLGEKTGVHFNLLRDPDGPQSRRLDALAYLLPGSRIIGASALHAAGWTTQFPRSLEIAAPPRRSFPTIPDVEISKRPRDWFSGPGRRIFRMGAIPILDPATALADAWVSGSWRPDPDELEWDEVDVEALRRAFADLGMDVPQILSVGDDGPRF